MNFAVPRWQKCVVVAVNTQVSSAKSVFFFSTTEGRWNSLFAHHALPSYCRYCKGSFWKCRIFSKFKIWCVEAIKKWENVRQKYIYIYIYMVTLPALTKIHLQHFLQIFYHSKLNRCVTSSFFFRYSLFPTYSRRIIVPKEFWYPFIPVHKYD